MVNSSTDFETMKACVEDRWDHLLKGNGTEVENSKIPVCWFENQTTKASGAVRMEAGNRMSWMGIGILASAVVSAVILGV